MRLRVQLDDVPADHGLLLHQIDDDPNSSAVPGVHLLDGLPDQGHNQVADV